MDAAQYTSNTTLQRFPPQLFCPPHVGVEMKHFTVTFKRFVGAIGRQNCSRCSAVGTVTKLWTGRPGVRIPTGASAFLSV